MIAAASSCARGPVAAGSSASRDSKEELAEAARILALNLAQYQTKYGELPAEDYLSLGAADNLKPELAKALADGMENLVGVLGSLVEQGGSQPDETTH